MVTSSKLLGLCLVLGAAYVYADCPNSCSGHGCCGHGSCLASSANSAMYSCSCDGGFSGVDCSSRLCPVGDDPMTKETYVGNSGQLQGDETQRVVVTGSASIA